LEIEIFSSEEGRV